MLYDEDRVVQVIFTVTVLLIPFFGNLILGFVLGAALRPRVRPAARPFTERENRLDTGLFDTRMAVTGCWVIYQLVIRVALLNFMSPVLCYFYAAGGVIGYIGWAMVTSGLPFKALVWDTLLAVVLCFGGFYTMFESETGVYLEWLTNGGLLE